MGEPRLHIEFEAYIQKLLWSTLTNNARYAIPFFSFVIVGMTYVIWDPLRMASVQVRVAMANLSDERGGDELSGAALGRRPSLPEGLSGSLLIAFVRARAQWREATGGLRGDLAERSGLVADFWRGRKSEFMELLRWIGTPQDRVMLMTGHRGNGQAAFLRSAAMHQSIWVDVGNMLEGTDDLIFMRRFTRCLGYWPTPFVDRQLTALLDALLPGSGKLSRDNELLGSVQRVLSGTTQALENWRHWVCKGSADADPNYMPPLVVIEGFTAENKDRRAGFLESLVEWAAYVTEARLARVVFVADSSFAEPTMLRALGDRPERLDVRHFPDAEPEVVREVLRLHWGADTAAKLPDEDLKVVGGRFRDVAALIAQVRDGEEPGHSVNQLLESSMLTVRTLIAAGQPDAKWTKTQLWRAVRLLASATGDSSVPYDVFLWSVFRGDEAALRSMNQSNLIAVVSQSRVTAGSPLYLEVFRRLTKDTGMAAVLDLEVAKEDIKREQATIDAYEAQLVRLQEVDDVRREKGRGLVDPNDALRKRKAQLLELMLEQHKKLESYHIARREAIAVLKGRAELVRDDPRL